MTLQGAYHLLVLCLTFLGLLLFVYRNKWKWVLRALFASVLLSMVRILPPILEIANFDTEFLSGFTTTAELFHGLTVLKLPIREIVFSNNPLNPLGWWELDFYIGLIGLLFVFLLGIYSYLFGDGKEEVERGLLLPILVMTVFSIGQLYDVFHKLDIPILSTQRVSSRLLFLPLAFSITMASVTLQRKLNGAWRNNWVKLGTLGSILLIAHDLWQHFKLWRVVNMGQLFPPTPLDLDRFFVANRSDPVYFALIVVGATTSLVSFLFLIILAVKDGDRNSITPN
jgi:hypothetical protein